MEKLIITETIIPGRTDSVLFLQRKQKVEAKLPEKIQTNILKIVHPFRPQ